MSAAGVARGGMAEAAVCAGADARKMRRAAFIGTGNMGGALIRAACRAIGPDQVLIADAQRDGLALLQQTRAAAADRGRELLRQAEIRAEAKGDEISRAAQAEGETLRREAESRLDAAADLIVGRVVKD